MNRPFLEEMLNKMKKQMKSGVDVGNLKIGALYALGSQLEAIFYFIGHELGSKLDDHQNEKDLVKALIKTIEQYHLGKIQIKESTSDHISFYLQNCGSCKEAIGSDVKAQPGFCSFEAGIAAGIVEKITGKHCFAQELSCSLEKKSNACEFIIVIPQE